MSRNRQRIPNITPAEWTDKLLDIFEFMEGPEARVKGPKYNAVKALVHAPEVSLASMRFHKALTQSQGLAPRLKELVILRVLWLNRAEYQWSQHLLISSRYGFGSGDYTAIKTGTVSPEWSELEALAIEAVDQLEQVGNIDDALWSGLIQHLNHGQILELLYLVGGFKMVAWIFNAIRLDLDPGMQGFSDEDWNLLGRLHPGNEKRGA
jgi:4-carboxymuconolactone decarboxylase